MWNLNYEKAAWWLVVTGAAFLVIFLVFYLATFNEGLSTDQAEWGLFGDYFGGVLGAILSFLALCLLFITVSFQSKELKLTREEFEKSTKALDKQNQHLKIQQVQNMLFNLLERKDLILSNIDYMNMEGHSALNEITQIYERGIRIGKEQHQLQKEAEIRSATGIMNLSGSIIEPHFNLFCSTCTYLQKQSIPYEVKEVLMRLLSDNLTMNEKKMLQMVFKYQIYVKENREASECFHIVENYQLLN